jgi:hypothetical protein
MMSANIWTGMCAAIVSAATVGAFAQAPQQTTTPQTTPQTTPAPAQAAPSSSDQKTVTITGCLKAAPAMSNEASSAANPNPTGTAGTTGTTAEAAAVATSGASAGADAKFILTAASASPADASATAQTYRLIANPTALSEHVGKKLELVGTLDPASTADPKDPSAAAPALRVQSGKIIAASCQE